MAQTILKQLMALTAYTFFMGFCFCDGFGLHIIRKLIWFMIYSGVSIYTFRAQNQFDLSMILTVSSLCAIVLCTYEKRKSSRKAHK